MSRKIPMIYLACPYTDPDPKVREKRYNIATRVAAALIRRGSIVFSPLTMTHPIDVLLAGEAKTLGSDYWVAFDEAFMDACSEMVVLKIDGWNESEGIKREIEYFERQNKPIKFIEPKDFDIEA